MTLPDEAAPLKIAWITASFPPEVTGVSLGNLERARWFADQPDVCLSLLIPEPHAAAAAATQTDSKSDVAAAARAAADGLEVHHYAAKAWLPYPVLSVPRRAALAQIDALLERVKPDLVVVTDIERSFLFASWGMPGRAYARRHGVPYIAQYQGDYLNFAKAYPIWRHLRTPLILPAMRYLYRRFDAAICATPHSAATLRSVCDVPICEVPFIGVDVAGFAAGRPDHAALSRLAPGYDGTGRSLLFLGRLAREKRIDLVIQAFHRLSAEPGNEKLSLFVAGDGPADAVAELQRLAAGSPRIHFVGFVHGADRTALYSTCDVFCTASPYETFGRTVVEAMASGIPVVTTARGGIADRLTDGRNAYLFEPDDAGALLAALRRALAATPADTAQLVTDAAGAVARLTVADGCTQLLETYRTLAGRRPRVHEPAA